MIEDAAQNSASATILVIDDEENMRHMLANMLTRDGYAVITAADGQAGLEQLQTAPIDFVLCDIRMPKMDGMAFLEAATALAEHTTIIMMSAYGTIDLAVEAMRLGAYDFISKPFKSDEVRLAIKKAAERNLLKRENLLFKEQIRRMEDRFRFGNLVAKSTVMQHVFELAAKVAPYDTTILIVGESGTGKELVAQAIHYAGPRAHKPLVPVNCGGIPESLLESELFGHVKGAFTGADRTRKGLFEEADGGTLFLDEIGEMPPPLQVKLLRVLQESEIRPVGQTVCRKVNVRVIAATSRNLAQMVAEGTFREDLYYRLNVICIDLPPLRDRNEDIPLLCRHFITQFNQSLGRNVRGIAPLAMSHLLQRRWPGNVRELENTIERAIVLSEDDWLKASIFNTPIDAKAECPPAGPMFEGYSIKDAQKVFEKELIIKALTRTDGNRTHAARLLEISHPSLLSKIKAYGIDL
jgi:two-component system, NtrC family, response regulator AtoC